MVQAEQIIRNTQFRQNTFEYSYSDAIDKGNLNNLSAVNSTFGFIGTYLTEFTIAGQGNYITSKGVVQELDFLNLTRNSRPYAAANGALRFWTGGTLIVGVGMDAYSWWNGSLSGSKFALNTGVSGWSAGLGFLGLGTVGLIGGATYFAIDTFSPGGMKGAILKSSSLQEQNQEILGRKFNLYRDF